MINETTERPLNIYFAGAIRAGRTDAAMYSRLIGYLGQHGIILTGHVGDESLLDQEKELSEQQIFIRDMQWMEEADCVIAEVSTPSLGVGFEIGIAQKMGKRILCLYRASSNCSLSAMIAGNPHLKWFQYDNIGQAEKCLEKWLLKLVSSIPDLYQNS